MLWILQNFWRYRNEIALAIAVIKKLRQTAREAAQEYIRRKIARHLKKQIIIVIGQVLLLLVAEGLTRAFNGLWPKLFASLLLWAITLYNAAQFLFSTLPEAFALRKMLKGKVGYAMKYVLEVSLVTELLQLNIGFLVLCLVLGISSRTYLGHSFNYIEPWRQWFNLVF